MVVRRHVGVWIVMSWCVLGSRVPATGQVADESDREQVGHVDANRAVTPVNQVLTPAGQQLDLPGMRPQTLALAPQGKFVVASGKTNELVVVNPQTAALRARVKLPSSIADRAANAPVSPNILKPEREGQVSFTGLVFAPAGDRIYMSNVEGVVEVFQVVDSEIVQPLHFWTLPAAGAPRREAEIPSGLAVSADGSRLYVCGNLSNRLLELDTANGKVLRTIDVGVAPYDVVLVGQKAYVSNWGGRRPGPDDLIGPAGRGTVVRVDSKRHIASEGSLSVIDLQAGKVVSEIVTGLHASGLAVSPDQRFVVCANAGSDHLSVVDARSDTLAATIWAKPNPAELLGASPNAVIFSTNGDRLLVANGSQNAVAVIEFDGDDPPDSKLIGLIPVGWYPGALLMDEARSQMVVANIKGLPKSPRQEDNRVGFNSHHYSGSLSFVPLPSDEQLADYASQVDLNLRRPRIDEALLPPRPAQPPRAIPQRIGEPSLIKHVVYIIKENRTYDQVFGGIRRGNGEPSLCIFGEQVTPNHHKLANEFVLLDNTYCAGILSADGHQWSTTAFSTDYLEKSFAGFPRSYPDGMGIDENDALSYSPAGFIWDRALERGITMRNYGEFMGPAVKWRDAQRAGTPNFLACYRAWKDNTQDVVFESWPSVETLRPFSPTDYVGWEMSVPDQFRADFVLKELSEFEQRGEFPQLVIICLPNDHTSGTSAGCPTPAACMADNDLAFGRIVEGLSHSRFWPQMAILAIEDDPQAGWDHVSGYRTIAFCISPYARRGQVVSTQYNTTSLLRTIEQILGLPPMNQFDASAVPMFDCFCDEPDLTPYQSVAANVPLDQMNPAPAAISDPVLRADALVSAGLNFREVDRAPEDVLNRILWRAVRGSAEPYPEWAAGVDDDDEDEVEED
jgi:YVTN family beta-propeller protein